MIISFLFKEMRGGDPLAKGMGSFSLGVHISTKATTFKKFVRGMSSFEVFV